MIKGLAQVPNCFGKLAFDESEMMSGDYGETLRSSSSSTPDVLRLLPLVVSLSLGLIFSCRSPHLKLVNLARDDY